MTFKKMTNQTKYKKMFQVILILSDWILIKQIMVYSTLFVFGKTGFQKVLPGVLIGELGHE